MCAFKYIWINKTQNLLKLQIVLFFSEALSMYNQGKKLITFLKWKNFGYC